MTRTRSPRTEPPTAIDLGELTAFETGSLEPRGHYEALAFVGLDLAAQSAADAVFVGCRLERCAVDALSIARARIAECVLADIHGASVDATDSTWRDTLVTGVRLGALTASGATWTDVRVRNAKLDFVDLSRSKASNVVFEDCVLGEVDLGEAQVRSVRFPGCTIDAIGLVGAKLADLDVSGATLGLLRGVEYLRGAVISNGQLVDLAPLLAERLGVEVRGA